MTTSTSIAVTPVKAFNSYIERLKPQMALALPKHMHADRMARLALTAFSSSEAMQKCEFRTIASALMTAGALGLEPGVNGAGFLIPYNGTCTFVPGWKGLVDLVSRSGRATVWTGAVFEGDHFEYALGDRPFVVHRPGDETNPDKLTHVYAIGRSNGSDYPVIEVWSMRKVWKHRDAINKQGGKHYSYKHPEMYARKVPLLQVLKYMPTSIEVANAITVAEASELGRSVVIDGDFVTVHDAVDDDATPPPPPAAPPPGWAADAFAKSLLRWQDAINAGQAHDAIVSFAKSKGALSEDQEKAIRALKKAVPPAGVVDAAGEVVTAGEPTWGDDSMGGAK